MSKAQTMTPHPENLKVYQKQMEFLAAQRKAFNDSAIASGRFGVEQIRTVSATERLTESIQKQKLTFSQAIKQIGVFKNAWREQSALQRASVAQFTGSMTGKNNIDMYIPKNLNGALDSFRVKYGYINEAIGSIAHQTVNWGKNTQWAGRQIMVGIGVPLAMLAGMAGKLFIDADKQLTRLAKVYDTTWQNQFVDSTDKAIASQQELGAARAKAMEDGARMARKYGQSLSDTLELEADLAATGLRGVELSRTTEQVTRIATLGELDHQTALDMTITLMSTMNQKAADLTNSFNYMNAIENATSLTTQDFATALPRMAGALTGVGVTVQQMGIMLTALKEGGVDAAEGANALKSATTRLLRPTAAAQVAFHGMGITISDVVARNGGNLFKILGELGSRMQGFSALQRQQAIAALFGTYQFNRLNVVMNNLADITNGALPEGFSQTARAAEIANQATSTWAATADKELAQAAQSVSGRFTRAIEGLKADLAGLGGPIMDAVIPIVEFVSRLIKKFQELPSFFKGLLKWLAIGGLLAGPIIMLLGLMGNLFGNFFKLMTNIANLGLRFKSLTPAQRANELMARRAASAFDSQASSTALLTLEMQKLLKVMNEQASMQIRNAALASGMTRRQAEAASRLRNPATGFKETFAERDARLAAEAAESSKKTRINMAKAAGAVAGLTMGVMAFNNMKDGSGSVLDNVMNITMLLAGVSMSGLGPGLAALLKKETWTKMATGITTAWGGGLTKVKDMWTKVNQMRTARWSAMTNAWSTSTSLAGKMSGFVKAMFGPVGLVIIGVTALVAGLAIWISHLNEAQKKQDEINRSAEKYAEIMGFEYTNGSPLGVPTMPDTQEWRRDAVEKYKEEFPQLVEDMQKAMQEGAGDTGNKFGVLFNKAMVEALKAGAHGASSSQTREVFQNWLQAAGLTEADIDLLSVRYDAVDVTDVDGLSTEISRQINNAIGEIRLPVEGFDINGLDDDSKAQISAVGELFASRLVALGDDVAAGSDAFRDLEKGLDKVFDHDWDTWFDSLDEGFQKDLKDKGINSLSEFQTYMDKHPGAFKVHFDTMDSSTEMALNQMRDRFKATVMEMLDSLLKSGLITQDFIDKFEEDNFGSLGSVAEAAGMSFMSLDDAMAGYSDAVSRAWMGGHALSEQEQLLILNIWRHKRGLDDATDVTQGFGDAMTTAAEDAATLEDALNFDIHTEILEPEQATSFLKDSMSNTMGWIYDKADKIAKAADNARQQAITDAGEATQKSFDDQLDALDDEFKAEDDAFKDHYDGLEQALEDQIDATNDLYDKKKDQVQGEIDALTAADDERQKLFDREKKRIERMAEMQNSSIDFNAALNSGNLDEAAKIYSTSSAKVQQYALDDQEERINDITDRKKNALEQKLEDIDAERDAKLDALDDEKDALADLRDAEEQAMKDRQDARKKDLDDQKAAAKEATDAALARDKAETDARQETLDQQLAALKAFIPKNEAEIEDHVAKIEQAYEDYGVDLTQQGDEWTGIIGTSLSAGIAEAAAGLQSDIGWEKIGAYIAAQVGKGTGLTMDSIVEFLKTGKFPEDPGTTVAPWEPNAKGANMKALGYKSLGNGKWQSSTGRIVYEHAGGDIGNDSQTGPTWSQADRAGVPRTAQKFPSEYHAILKRGEFVVNARDARRNIDLLKAINAGGMVPGGDPGQRGINVAQYLNGMGRAGAQFGIHHSGGLIGSTALMPGAYGAMLGITEGIVMKGAADHLIAAQAASANNNADAAYIGAMSQSINKVLAVARSMEGTPYIWGGAGPSGADCSGFMSILQNAVYGMQPPWGRRYVTASFSGGAELDGWKRGGGPTNAFRIGVDPGSHMAGTFAGINVESGSGHGAMVGKSALGANSGFAYQYYLPAADHLPQLRAGGTIKYDNTLANLHKKETVLSAPLTKAFQENVANGFGNEYKVCIEFNGPVNSDLDVRKAVQKAIDEIENKNGRKRVIK